MAERTATLAIFDAGLAAWFGPPGALSKPVVEAIDALLDRLDAHARAAEMAAQVTDGRVQPARTRAEEAIAAQGAAERQKNAAIVRGRQARDAKDKAERGARDAKDRRRRGRAGARRRRRAARRGRAQGHHSRPRSPRLVGPAGTERPAGPAATPSAPST